MHVFTNNVPVTNFKEFILYAKEQLLSCHKVEWLASVRDKPKLHLYSVFKTEYKAENYCTVNLKRQQRSMLAKLRLGTLPINVEMVRYTGTPRDERWCL